MLDGERLRRAHGRVRHRLPPRGQRRRAARARASASATSSRTRSPPRPCSRRCAPPASSGSRSPRPGSVYGEPEVFPTPEDAPVPGADVALRRLEARRRGADRRPTAHGYGFTGVIFRFVSILGERYTHGHVFDFYRAPAARPDAPARARRRAPGEVVPLRRGLRLGDDCSSTHRELEPGAVRRLQPRHRRDDRRRRLDRDDHRAPGRRARARVHRRRSAAGSATARSSTSTAHGSARSAGDRRCRSAEAIRADGRLARGSNSWAVSRSAPRHERHLQPRARCASRSAAAAPTCPRTTASTAASSSRGAIDKYVYMLTHTVFQRRYRMKYSQFEEVDDPSRDPPSDPARGAPAPLERRPAGDRVGRRRAGRDGHGLVGRLHRLPPQGARPGPPRRRSRPGASPRTPARSRSTSSGSRSASRTSTSPRTAASARTRSIPTARSTSSRSSSRARTLERLRDNLLLFYTGEARVGVGDPRRPGRAHGDAATTRCARTSTGPRRSGFEVERLLEAATSRRTPSSCTSTGRTSGGARPGMATERIDHLYTLARRSGVIGGKLVGAGRRRLPARLRAATRRHAAGDGGRAARRSSRSTSSSRAAPAPSTHDVAERRPALRVGHRRLRADRPQARGGARRGRARRRASTSTPARPRSLADRVRRHGVRIARRAARARARRRDRGRHARPARRERLHARSRPAPHVLVEKPAGIGVADVGADRRRAADARAGGSRSGSTIAFTRASARAIAEARSGRYGDVLHLRARYGHGGRLGYEREWRAQPARLRRRRARRPGDAPVRPEPLALRAAAARTRRSLRTQYWPMDVEDNAVLVLGEPATRGALGDAPRELDGVEEPVLARDLLPHGEAPGRRPRGVVRARRR